MTETSNFQGLAPKYSVVIPVYNSQGIVGQTVDRVIAFFEGMGWKYEIILVNDGSCDGSWQVISDLARTHKGVKSINLLRNYGQHTAILAGFHSVTGDFVVTMDDDLQNPPEEIEKLVARQREGDFDLVIGNFREKKHSLYRRLGSKLVRLIDQRVFGLRRDLLLTNFRLLKNEVVKRVCEYRTSYPYIGGLILMFSSNQANVMVEHHPRRVGKSNYNTVKIIELVARLLFNYSSYPLRMVAYMGFAASIIGFILGLFYLLKALFIGRGVPGWTSLIVLLAFFSGLIILMLGMIGEYLIRLINQTSSSNSFQIIEKIQSNE